MTGQCTCKVSTKGRTCDTCKDGFYKFPTSLNNQCEECPCNIGGALPSCNKLTGISQFNIKHVNFPSLF